MAYRNKTRSGKVLAEGILEGYNELYQLYPDAHTRNIDELKAFFVTKSTSGKQVISKTVTTFRKLCELADFEGVEIESQTSVSTESAEYELEAPTKIIKGLGAGVTININIQLALPATKDESVYDDLFKAMKKHLLS